MSVGILWKECGKIMCRYSLSLFPHFFFHLAEEHPPLPTGSPVSASPKFCPPEFHRDLLLMNKRLHRLGHPPYRHPSDILAPIVPGFSGPLPPTQFLERLWLLSLPTRPWKIPPKAHFVGPGKDYFLAAATMGG